MKYARKNVSRCDRQRWQLKSEKIIIWNNIWRKGVWINCKYSMQHSNLIKKKKNKTGHLKYKPPPGEKTTEISEVASRELQPMSLESISNFANSAPCLNTSDESVAKIKWPFRERIFDDTNEFSLPNV